MKLLVMLAALLLLLGADVQEQSPEDYQNEQLERLGMEEVEEFWEEISQSYGPFLPESEKDDVSEWVSEHGGTELSDWISAGVQFFFHELSANIQLLGTLILLAVFSTLLRALQNAFEQETVSRVAYSVVFIVLFILVANSFYVAMDYARDAVGNMVHFMIALLPMMLALLATTGAVTSAALFHPLIIFFVNTSGLLIESVVLPLLFLSALLSIVSFLNERFQLTKLAALLRNTAMGLLGLFLTVFLGVISVQGATAAVSDGIAVRTAKYIAGNFVPIVGRIFTDAADTVLGASMLVKNTVGAAGLLILFLICAFPAIKLLALAAVYYLSAAVLQPLGGGPMLDCLSLLGRTVLFMFAALSVVGLMFFLALTMIIASGNMALMMR
ncbi:stage III sporulation protein AE [Salsuginibacillus halophilus]|uniref:Stage III sporulation protein AE n=1 Tax=Salsuginibacillus halophilus TaxID=517424 RepID=A0A2P8HAG6_9BACI|nr:stage III sporulation protein AE [Salsuginibacillus halophilus]PSL43190.1 stage III sporulation protein AE [Salsuginibacillus halophilus]